MKIVSNTAKIAGNPDENGCSQSYEIRPEDPSKLNTHGNLHLSVSIKDISDNTQSIFVIRGIVAQIQKKFYENTTDGTLEALKEAVSSTIETYQKDIEIASVVVNGSKAFIVTYGTAEVLLKRGDKFASFKSPNGAIYQSAGELNPGDMLILATKRFVDTTSQGVLNAALEKSEPQKIVDFLAPSIQSKEHNSTICASFIKFKSDESSRLRSQAYPKINTAVQDSSSEQEVVKQEAKLVDDDRPQEVHEQGEGLLSKLKPKRFYIKDFKDEKANKRRRLLSFAGVFLILLLSGTVVFGLHKKQQSERQVKIQEITSIIEKDLQEAEEIFSYSPQRSQELIERSRQELQKLEDPELNAEDRLAELRNKIDQAQGSVLGLHSAQANDFLDLDLLSSGFSGDLLSVYNSEIYVLDTSNQRLIQVNVSNKRSEVLAGKEELEGVKRVAAWSEDVYVLKDDGIYDLEGQKLLDSDWSDNSLIKSYIGNIYILDKGDSEIYRYSIEDDGGLGPRTDWLTDEVSADFSKIVSWGIDGEVWLSSSSGSVFKYAFGFQQNFSLDKVAPELTTGANISVSSENDYIYLLDKENSRILVFDKEGNYQEQYNQDIIKEAKDIAAFENEQKIILLSGDKLKYIDIK